MQATTTQEGTMLIGPRWIYTNTQGVTFTAFRSDSIAILRMAAKS